MTIPVSAPSIADGLFPRLLGGAFARLDPRVRAVHGGGAGRWQGEASIRWGSSSLAGWLNRLARMPRGTERAPAEVSIAPETHRETWTRRFGDARRLRSTLRALDGRLVERMGIITMWFRLEPARGGVDWLLERVAVLGVPLPRGLVAVSAHSGGSSIGYTFSVQATVRGIGPLIAYEGVLHVHDT